MKKIFCKVIELESTQVLVVKDVDKENEQPCIVVTLFVNDICIQQMFTFEDPKTLDESFDYFNEQRAQELYNGVKKVLEENKDGNKTLI